MSRARTMRPPKWTRLKLCRRREGEPYAEFYRRQRLARSEWLDMLVFRYLMTVVKGTTSRTRHKRNVEMAFGGFKLSELSPEDVT